MIEVNKPEDAFVATTEQVVRAVAVRTPRRLIEHDEFGVASA